jgi:hypothetical protein
MSTDKRKVLKPLKEMETIWHPDSGLVFKSKTEKVVTGRWVNSEFVPLDEDSIELCAQWSFKYDQELYDELMAEGEEADEVESDETGEGEVGETGEEVEGDVDETGEEVEGEGDVDETVVTENVVEVVVSKQTSSKDLDNLTSGFTNNLNSYFQTLTNDFSSKISILETKLSNKSDEFVKMTENRDKLKDELSKMTEDRDKIKEECEKFRAKFEGFKSFFNN